MPNPSWCRILCRRGAAPVMARRAVGFPERMTAELKRKVAPRKGEADPEGRFPAWGRKRDNPNLVRLERAGLVE